MTVNNPNTTDTTGAGQATGSDNNTVNGFANVVMNNGQQDNTNNGQADNQNDTGANAGAGQGQPQSQQNNNEPQGNERDFAKDSILGGSDVDSQVSSNVPEKYDSFQLNGNAVDEKVQESFSTLSRNLGLDQSQAQTTLNSINDYLVAESDRMSRQWAEETRNDPEIGGAHLKETQKYANSALTSFFGVKAQELFKSMGLLNHPEFIRGLSKIGRSVSQDAPRELVGGNSAIHRQAQPNPMFKNYDKYNDPNYL